MLAFTATPSALSTSWPATETRDGLTSIFWMCVAPQCQYSPGPSTPLKRPLVNFSPRSYSKTMVRAVRPATTTSRTRTRRESHRLNMIRVRKKVFRLEAPPANHGGLNPQGGPQDAV